MVQKKVKDAENTEETKTEKDKLGEESVESVKDEKEEVEKTPARNASHSDASEEEIENKEQEYLEGWKRCMADFENYKKRQAESQKDLIRYSTQNIVLQILPVIDNFHSATGHIPEEQKNGAWVAGIMHIQKQLENILKENGVEEIEVKVGDEFDPAIHEAVGNEERSKKNEVSDKISKIVLKGYKIGEKVVRAAKVVV